MNEPTEREKALELAKTYHDRCPTDDGAHGIVSRQLLTEAARVDALEKELDSGDDAQSRRNMEKRIAELEAEIKSRCMCVAYREFLNGSKCPNCEKLTDTAAKLSHNAITKRLRAEQERDTLRAENSKLMAVVDAAAEVMRVAEGRQVEAAVIVPLNNLRHALAALRGEG